MSSVIETVAAVLEAPGEDFVCETVQLSPPGASEVLVRIEASGVCHSDWNAATGASATPTPAVLGHEGAGVVEQVGSAVTRVSPGDKVVLSWLPSCGLCAACLRGELSLCTNATSEMGRGCLPSGAFHLSRGSSRLYHYSYLSTFARHAVVDERSCVPLPADADLEVACLVGCAVTTGICAVFNKAKVAPGSSVIIFGAGGVGLSALIAARLAGAAFIVVVDPVASKRASSLLSLERPLPSMAMPTASLPSWVSSCRKAPTTPSRRQACRPWPPPASRRSGPVACSFLSECHRTAPSSRSRGRSWCVLRRS